MNYRHAYHAGNFADVFKHIILSRIIVYMQRKEKAFRVYDTHAGIGLYQLDSEQAEKTGEHVDGVDRVLKQGVPESVARLIGPWRDIVEASPKGTYPGSPSIARQLLRKQDRLSLYEFHPEDAETLRTLFAGDYQTRVNHLDGWLVSGAHIPPKEGRGLMLVDPPFEEAGEFDRMIDALEKARKRWAGGTIALWYPVKRRSHTDEWLGTLEGMKFPDLLNVEIYIREPRDAKSLNGCGMVIVNPPFTLRAELHEVLPWLSEICQQAKGYGYRVQDFSAR